MALHELSLGNLLKLDGGRVVEAFDQAVARCIADCKDRPAVAKARKVTLELQLLPAQDDDGDIRDVKSLFLIKDSAPIRQSRVYSLEIRGSKVAFNDLSTGDARQRTLDQDSDAFETDEN